MRFSTLYFYTLQGWFASASTSASAKRSVYQLAPDFKKHRRNLHHHVNATKEDGISFDGNLDALISRAYAMAREEGRAEENSTAPVKTSQPIAPEPFTPAPSTPVPSHSDATLTGRPVPGTLLPNESDLMSSAPVISSLATSNTPTQSTLEPVTVAPTFMPSNTNHVAPVTPAPVTFAPVISDTSSSGPLDTNAQVSPANLAQITSAPVESSEFVSSAPQTFSPVPISQSITSTPMAQSVTSAPVTTAPIVQPMTTAPLTHLTLAPATAPGTIPSLQTTAPVTAVPNALGNDAPNGDILDTDLTQSKAPQTLAPQTLAPQTLVPQADSLYSDETVRHTVLNCDIPFHSFDEIPYRFLIEYERSNDAQFVIAALEADMNAYLASRLLPCAAGDNGREVEEETTEHGRYLRQEIGIVALDSAPADEITDADFCEASRDDNNCKVVDGKLRVYFAISADPVYVHYKVRVEIRNYLNSILLIDGLYATKYLSPSIISPTLINSGESSISNRFDARSALSLQSVTLFAFAGVALVFSVILAYWFRNSRENSVSNAPPSPETTAFKSNAPSSKLSDDIHEIPRVNTTDTGSGEDEEPLSPFSRMLPAAYRIEDSNDEMSVILELNESNYSGRSTSIIMSEGYSDDGASEDIDLSTLNFSRLRQAPVLGAKRMKELKNCLGNV